MDHINRTRIAFGLVEAYAMHHRRIAPVTGTSIWLSLQEPAARRDAQSRLFQLVDGAALNIDVLRHLLPSLGDVTWTFAEGGDFSSYQLTTRSGEIQVSLFTNEPTSPSARFELDGRLRGIAARIVVELEYGG